MDAQTIANAVTIRKLTPTVWQADFKFNYAVKDAVKAAGFRYNPEYNGKKHVWITSDPTIAAKFMPKEEAQKVTDAQVAAIEASKAHDSDFDVPKPDGCEYLPYQRAGIAYAVARKNVLIGDDMGLGKTVQSIGIANTDVSCRKILIICPASLKLNWKKEWKKWDVKGLSVLVAGTKDGGKFADYDVVIINYDIVRKLRDAIDAQSWDLLIVDEAHMCKNAKSLRSIAILGKKSRTKADRLEPIVARRRVFMTGTPIVNRPIELWPIVQSLDPNGLGADFMAYAKRYCAAHQISIGRGKLAWDFSGASNLNELQIKLRTSIMVRRLKSEVLNELPPKRRQIIEVPGDGFASLIKREKETAEKHAERMAELRAAVEFHKAGNREDYENAITQLREANSVEFTEMSRIRHELAIAKIPLLIEHLKDSIEASGKVILFVVHKDVVRAIKDEFGGAAVTLTGDMAKMEDRQASVDRFQTDPTCTLFIGTIGAAGVGITLTASSHVVFGEADWVPGNVSQCEDRANRIGQTNSVLIQHLVVDGTIDARVMQTVIRKQEIIDKALDNDVEIEPIEPITIADVDQGATFDATRGQIADEAKMLTQAQVDAIYEGLGIMTRLDYDMAKQKNGLGFNKVDSHIGRMLALTVSLTPKQAALGKKILQKYRGQLGEELMIRINGKDS